MGIACESLPTLSEVKQANAYWHAIIVFDLVCYKSITFLKS